MGVSGKMVVRNMYLKITNLEENHHGLQYMDGLNVDPVPFVKEGTCVPGGIYFTTPEYICNFLHMGCYIREVMVPEDAEMVEDPSRNKWRASKVILGPRKDLSELETWKWLVDNGSNIHACDNYALRLCSCLGYFEVVKYLVENGADIKAGENEAFRFAAYYGHIDVVKYLVEKGAFIDEWAMRNSSGVVRDYLLTKIEVAICNCSQTSNGK